MRLIYRKGDCEIWESFENYGHGPVSEFYAYNGPKLIRVCPSVGMAHEVLAEYV